MNHETLTAEIGENQPVSHMRRGCLPAELKRVEEPSYFEFTKYIPEIVLEDCTEIITAAKRSQQLREGGRKENRENTVVAPLKLPENIGAFFEIAKEWPELFITQENGNARKVHLLQWEDDIQKGYQISHDEDGITVKYSDLSSRNRALFHAAIEPELQMDKPQRKVLNEVGLLLDVSRGGVYTVDFMKKIIRLAAVCGYDKLWLYQEFSHVEDQPNHPINRLIEESGMYSGNEIREFVEYADEFGISVQPAGQYLGHMEHILALPEFNKYKYRGIDEKTGLEKTFDNVLDPRIPGVFEEIIIPLIRNNFKQYFSSERKNSKNMGIHIGLDEVLGMPMELFGEHAKKIYELVMLEGKKYGYDENNFSVSYWRDNRAHPDLHTVPPIPSEVLEGLPKQLIDWYWEYDETDEVGLQEDIQRTYRADSRKNPQGFATSAQLHNREYAFWERAEKNINAHFDTTAKQDSARGMITYWGDDGAAASFRSGLPSFSYFATRAYGGDVDDNKIFFKGMVRDSMQIFTEPSRMNFISEKSLKKEFSPLPPNVAKILTLEDPRLPFSRKTDIDFTSYYKEQADKLLSETKNIDPENWAAMEHARTIVEFIQVKREALANLAVSSSTEVDHAIQKLVEMWIAHRRVWLEEKKEQGLETIDIRNREALLQLYIFRASLLADEKVREQAQDGNVYSENFPVSALRTANSILSPKPLMPRKEVEDVIFSSDQI